MHVDTWIILSGCPQLFQHTFYQLFEPLSKLIHMLTSNTTTTTNYYLIINNQGLELKEYGSSKDFLLRFFVLVRR